MKIHIPDFNDTAVLVCGDLMLDRYWHGSTSRISPEAPVPVVHVGEAEERPGGAGNVALNISALGCHTVLLGLTGDDEAADALQRRLEGPNIHCDFERVADCSTITKLRVLSRHQQLIRLDFEDGFHHHPAENLLQRFTSALETADIAVLSDYGKGTLHAIQTLIAAARSARKMVLVDPKGNDFERYCGATLLTPNLAEFEAVVGHCANDEILVEKGEQLRATLQLEALLITRSEQGMTLIQRDQDALHLPTRAREVYDVTGAGDTVISTLAAALGCGETMANATALANLAASIVVGKLGTASIAPHELRRAVREQSEAQRGVIEEAHLATAIADAKAHGERVVMTNGCFDILHAGHVTYLEQARALGDRLVVAVNTDASVKRLKGEERPMNTLQRRMRVLAGLACVDWVVAFDEDTPTQLICHLLPDILVKGGDNNPMQIPGGDCVRANGGEVKVMEYIDNCSTTGLINTIRARSPSDD
ncbi:MAG: bifunctional D-glycero-beta-D-manno-heptose-7-phosphate kinase/D-glycero-beta-D-manno-heptose 1-phosphate adenylyltransferase HldE [Gammaproteobacteria bacterium]|nr:bifunctional D-glycero-beta-D-manno-heptose-7-phosphate kinase/D-glycero-beta-D-manno-heptose 1-phosphate adenylyltransferase HldE [Gammaproteobacteria bacterium]